jgi:hypothetical protein
MSQTCECEETDQQSFQTRTILTLPDHFLIAVLKCLNLKQLLRCARYFLYYEYFRKTFFLFYWKKLLFVIGFAKNGIDA